MNIYDFTLNELENYLVSNGFKKFNATQIIEWMYEKGVYDFNKMTNLSKIWDVLFVKVEDLKKYVI